MGKSFVSPNYTKIIHSVLSCTGISEYTANKQRLKSFIANTCLKLNTIILFNLFTLLPLLVYLNKVTLFAYFCIESSNVITAQVESR